MEVHTSAKIRVVLADDHAVVRQGVRALLNAEPDVAVVGEAANGLEVTELVAQLRPDVLVLDLMMPGLGGLEVMQRIAERADGTKVVILSMHAGDAYVLEAMRQGAMGYVLKDAGATELTRAIREAWEGRKYLSPPLSFAALQRYQSKAMETQEDPYEDLTPREREVFLLTARGLTAAKLAELLGISPRTVEAHRANILHKLGLRGPADIVRYALRRALIPPDSSGEQPPGDEGRLP